MTSITLTAREKQWRERARRAVDDDEKWEACAECMHHHPTDYDGPCDDLENRLPGRPADLIG
jgi:hypothetical protein